MRVVFVAAGIAIGAYYLWAVRAANDGFFWKKNLPGYYDHLARGFVSGHLYLPIEPSPALLALPDPWDPDAPNSLKLWDSVLYQRRYYLYHGAGPAVMLFAPWRLLTGHDLPENFALFAFCFGGFLFSAGALAALLRKAGVTPAAWQWGLMLVALGTCTGVGFLMNRVWVYEIAIGAGYFCVGGGIFFYLCNGRARWLFASGLMFGIAIACRPHLGLMGLFALVVLRRSGARRVAAFAIPFVLAGASVGIYNYERFGNPLDFGNRHLLGGANETEVKLGAGNVPPGLFYLLVSPPKFGPVFPWVSLPCPPYSIPRPMIYTVESTVGALFLAPFFVGAFFVRRNRLFLGAALGVLLFITATGWSTQRYVFDFLPWFVLFAMVALARARAVWWIPIGGTILFGMTVNLALGIAGPYDEMIRNYPARFVKIAGWFSPVERYRPVLDPPLDLRFRAPNTARRLVRAGRYELSIENRSGQPTMVSSLDGKVAEKALEAGGGAVDYRLVFEPRSEEVHVTGDGAALIDHKIGHLVAAPSEIEIP